MLPGYVPYDAARNYTATGMDFDKQMQNAQKLWEEGNKPEGLEAFRRAAEMEPENPIARSNYGMALAKTGAAEQALPILERVAADMPDYPEVFFNLGHVYRLLLRLDDAVKAFSRAIELRPDFAQAHWDRSLALLLSGNFSRGWEGFDWRFRLPGKKPLPFRGRAWDGSLDALAGKTLILGAEQGFGDTIQFARYIPLLAEAGAKIILICHAEVRTLIGQIRGISQVLSPPTPIQPFDFHAPLMSLGKLMRTDLHSIPANVPYLSARPAGRLSAFTGTRKIGLVWAGRASHANDANRSVALNDFASLADLPGVTLVSLLKGAAVEEIRSVPFGSKIIEFGGELKDFSDTVSLIAELDLLISVDTAVVHLAGAMGKPVWTLLPYNPDWRWMLNRTDSPWYPTMQLFRQPRPREWNPVIQAIHDRLTQGSHGF